MRVIDLMKSPVTTVAPNDSLHVADGIMSLGVGCLPAMEHGGLVGIVTTSDLLRAIAGPCDAEADRAGAIVNGMAPAASRVPRREA